MLGAALAPVSYVAGSAAVVAAVAALAWGSWRMRRAVLPEWLGPPARLAETVIALTALVGMAQLLGVLGVLSRGPALAATIAVGVALGVVGTRIAPGLAPAQVPAPRPVVAPMRVEEVVVTALAVAVLAAQWVTHVAFALSRGMTHPDTLWYHAPYAARFVQDGRVTDLVDRSDVIQAYFPLNSQLVHAVAILPFDRDVLSPLVNLGWAALALLAAWCIGRRRGLGPLCVLGTAVVLGLPMIAGTHPGQASNDVACAALLLAAVALLLDSDLAPAPTAVAALAAGLGLGTKLTVAVPLLIVTVGVVVLAVRARRALTAVVWCAGVVLTSALWFARNWAVADNPLPWFELDLGPFSLPAPAREEGASVVDRITEGSAWSDLFFPGLSQGLGRLWPVVLGVALASMVILVARHGRTLERIVGVALLGGFVGYLFTPTGGGFNFAFNLRYLSPVLLLAFALLPITVDGLGALLRRATLVVFAVLVVANAFSRHRERLAAWPRGYLLPGVLAGVAVIAVVVIAARGRWPTIRIAVPALAAVVVVGVVGGWFVQRHYLEHRYVDAGLRLDAVNASFRDVGDERVAVFGTVEVYPMFGLDLSNEVTQGGAARTGRSPDPCREFADVRAGRYRYVVLTQFGVVFPSRPPEDWFLGDPNATEIVRDGESLVYRLDGPLDPVACADD
jgi:4-amino-4-deoxy-L-arabinose transferase-like glycosyltransferase